MTAKNSKTQKAIETLREAVLVRKQITELYKKYREFTDMAVGAADLNHRDVKRAVDAMYYLGGGWPSENSKGRMEALLDNFVGMYRILEFTGSGHYVREHLALLGVTVTLDPQFAVTNKELTHNEIAFLKNLKEDSFHEVKTVRDLVAAVLQECELLQGEICQLADTIKDELRPAAQKALNLEDPEYDRLHSLVAMSDDGTPRSDEKVINKKAGISQSMSAFNVGVSAIAVKKETK